MQPTPAAAAADQPTCFVVMGFGKKTDFETSRVLDLDKSYRNMIKPAVEKAGLKCIRADEITHSGLIDVPMYEQLLSADVVVADLSTSNKNAYYELGIRHALRPYTTIIVAEDGIKAFPFDVNHVAVRQYHHLGEDIGYDEVLRFQELLTKAIVEIRAATAQNPDSRDSPVYTFLQNLTPPALRQMQAAATAAAVGAAQQAATDQAAADQATAKTHSMLMAEVYEAKKSGNWLQMKALLEVVRQLQAQARAQARQAAGAAPALAGPDREDPYLLLQLALATYKSKLPTEAAALQAARDLLAPLDPATSNDPQVLAAWGTIHKLRAQLTARALAPGAPVPDGLRADLDESVRAHERGFHLRSSYYNGINYAFMLNARAAVAPSPAEAIADYVQAQRARREVLAFCEQWLAANPARPADPAADADAAAATHQLAVERYWAQATQAEALAGLGNDAEADRLRQEIDATVPEPWMADTATQQLQALRQLLQTNPLRYLNA